MGVDLEELAVALAVVEDVIGAQLRHQLGREIVFGLDGGAAARELGDVGELDSLGVDAGCGCEGKQGACQDVTLRDRPSFVPPSPRRMPLP